MSSTADSWEQATRIFGEARELAPADRAAYLDRCCGPDGRLRAAVERLLAGDVADSFLARPPWSQILASGTAPDQGLREGELLNDRYRIDRALGSGGQADVFLAFDIRLARAVVVKAMRAIGVASALLIQRFEREMQALSRIDHPGVVGILDVGALPGGAPFLVVQHVDGITLRERLRQARLAPAAAADIVRQLGAALRAAHAAGVVHGDLKPENVIVKEESDGRLVVRLIDFGMARVEHPDVQPGMTLMIAGTVRYMAPEQFEGRNLPASDVYALALTACELLGGEPDVRPLRDRAPGAVIRVLERGLAYRAEQRPADVARFAEDVAAVIAGRGTSRRRVLIAVGAVTLLGVGVGAGWLIRTEPEPRIIEKVGAFDPTVEGFETHNEIDGTVVANPTGDGYEAWRVVSPRQGHYFLRLSRAQKRLALANGWTLGARMRVEAGAVFAFVDFSGEGPRFSVTLVREADGDQVRLLTRVTPSFEGLDVRLPHDGAYHLYELRYDPGLAEAALWIDGEKRLGGYRGIGQYQGDGDLAFGATVYKNSAPAVGDFQSLRFEIHP